jgi:hypothetical protein
MEADGDFLLSSGSDDELLLSQDSMASSPDSMAGSPDSMAASPDSMAGSPDSMAATMDNELPDSESVQFVPDSEPFDVVKDSQAVDRVPVEVVAKPGELDLGPFLCRRCRIIHRTREEWNLVHVYRPCSRCGVVNKEHKHDASMYGEKEWDCKHDCVTKPSVSSCLKQNVPVTHGDESFAAKICLTIQPLISIFMPTLQLM